MEKSEPGRRATVETGENKTKRWEAWATLPLPVSSYRGTLFSFPRDEAGLPSKLTSVTY